MTAKTAAKRNKAEVNGTSKVMTSMAFIVSVAVHLVIFLFVGSVVIFEGAIPPNLFTSMSGDMIAEEVENEMDLPPLLEEELEPEPLEVPMEDFDLETEMDLSEAMSSSDLIITNAATPTFTPSFSKPVLTVETDTGSKLVSQRNKTKSDPGSGPGTPRTANIFGRTVSAANFGAILDISGSTHKTIDVAVNEIKSGFPDALLVLTPGCSLSQSSEADVIDGITFKKNRKDYHYQGREEPEQYFYAAYFLEKLVNSNKNFGRLWSRAVKDERGFVVHGEIVDKPKRNSRGILVASTKGGSVHHAIEFLIDEGCDVIYWMADYDDKVNEASARNMIKLMKRSDVKLIQHDFNGQTDGDKKNRSIVKQMVEQTDGQIIIGSGS
ncbi:MAG: hypothetical protein AAF571_04225 [Verrucomicrobiota bacterium]